MSTLVQLIIRCRHATSHFLRKCWLEYCHIRSPKWVNAYLVTYHYISMKPSLARWTLINSLEPSNAIWRQRSGSPLAQVMACCLTAPSHFLNQCWLIISKVEWHSSKGNFTRDTLAINPWNCLKNYVHKMSFKFPSGQWLMLAGMVHSNGS